jgi:hypothetical protein
LDDFDSLSAIEKYRAYIRMDKPFATWTKRNKPEWYNKQPDLCLATY